MVLITWNSDYSVGIKQIDEQHKQLIAMINQLHLSMMKGEGSKVLDTIVVAMLNYTKTHFSTEEIYMQRFNYEGMEEHKKIHKEFIDKVADFEKKVSNGELGVSMEVMNFLKDWLLNHIQGTDKKYTKCFYDHGLR